MTVDIILLPAQHYLELRLVVVVETSKSLSTGLINTMIIGESLHPRILMII